MHVRNAWVTPRLLTHGTVEAITQTVNITKNPGGSDTVNITGVPPITAPGTVGSVTVTPS